MALPSELLKQVDQITLNYTAKAYQAIVDAHRTELRLMLIVYVALFGIAVFQGMVSMSLKESTKHLLKVLIFFQLATNWGTFTTFFYDVFTHGPEKMTVAMIGGSDPNQQLEDVFVTGMEAARQIYDKAGITDLSQMLLALMIFIGTLLMTGFALFLLILAKLGLAILLSIAPLFLSLGFWKSTQGLFQGWINYLVNYALIPVITFALLGLVLILMQEPLNQIKSSGENLDMVAVIPFMLVGAISTLLFSQILRIASSLGSGVALSTMGAFGRYVNTPASNLMRLGAKQVAKSSGRLAKAGYSSIVGRFRNAESEGSTRGSASTRNESMTAGSGSRKISDHRPIPTSRSSSKSHSGSADFEPTPQESSRSSEVRQYSSSRSQGPASSSPSSIKSSPQNSKGKQS